MEQAYSSHQYTNQNTNQKTSFAIYQRHKPEQSLLYKVVQNTWPDFILKQEQRGVFYSKFIHDTFDGYLKCGIPEHGFVRLYCKSCRDSQILAFSCKRRGFCPSCHSRRMSELAAHLVDNVLPSVPYRQWVLSLPFDLRYQVLQNPALTSILLKIFIQSVNRFLKSKARKVYNIKKAIPGSIAFIQRWGSALNSNPHFHVIFLEFTVAH